MKSLALSLLVALGVSLGAATAFADAPRAQTPSAVLANAQEASRLAAHHEKLARDHRVAARMWTEKASDALKIAKANTDHGFTYEAGVMQQRALNYQRSAAASTAAANREETTAAMYRARAKQQMQQYQQALGGSVAPKW